MADPILAAQFKAFGGQMPESLCDQFVLWPEHYPVVQLFLSCQTQWRSVASSAAFVRLGLDYTAVESALRMSGIARRQWPKLFKDLRVMEYEALRVFNSEDDWD
ncbi:DUF1799 domain-containing protein [Deefgea piscis]|uniref:DUF1799 domain-containing protein n=1 Tax=Deefgea piscis TaxID=2739061 RepID=UPI001C7F9AFC|nr:DUF1799 domain-containing protein [Deefgea piscis]QZA80863.1 DUF1799 domain-containing protein [Deefgea piscis]